MKAIVQRDVREIAEVEKLDQMPRLMQVLAHHSAQLTNFTQVGGQIGLDDKTTRKYVGILEQLFLVRRVEPWFRNRLKRLVRHRSSTSLTLGCSALFWGQAPRGGEATDRASASYWKHLFSLRS